MKRIISMVLSLIIVTSVFWVSYAENEIEENINIDSDSISIYVSVDGNDKNPGTIEKPLATFAGAKEMVRKYKNEEENKPINVYFRGGEYRLTNGLDFTFSDSGTDTAPITYQSYNDEQAVFLGSRRISVNDFNPVTDKAVLERIPEEARCYVGVYDLKGLGIKQMEKYITIPGYGSGAIMNETMAAPLYMNNKEQVLARYPNGHGNYISMKTKSDRSFEYEDERGDRWAEAPNAKILGGLAVTWAYERAAIESIDTQNNIITLKEVPGGGITNRGLWSIDNLIEELDIPGEYYVDEDNLKLYFYPPYSVANSELEIALDSFDCITMNKLENVSFKKLEFKNFRRNLVRAFDCRKIGFYGCNINNIAAHALYFDESREIVINGCDISNIGGTAVGIQAAINPQLIPDNNVVHNCRIHAVGQKQKTYNPGIWMKGVGNEILNCVIYDSPHNAILFEGNDNKILYNEIYDCVKECLDSSAIYTLRNLSYGGNELAYNYLHDINAQTKSVDTSIHRSIGMYFDDAASGMDVHHNVFANVQQAILHGGGVTNKVYDNIVVNGEHGGKFDMRGAGWMVNVARSLAITLQNKLEAEESAEAYSKYENLDKIPGLVKEFNALWPFFSHVDNNLFYNNIIDPDFEGEAYTAKYYASSDNNIITKNKEEYGIEFVNEEIGDYSIKEGSPILEKLPGLAEIDLTKIGIYESEYRTQVDYSLGEFKQYYPKNNVSEISNLGTYATWDAGNNAGSYKVIVAKDSEFKNIINEYYCNYNYFNFENIETGFVDHYWKVLAIDNGYNVKAFRESENKYQKFTTTQYDIVDKTAMNVAIADAERFVSTLSEGKEPGQVAQGSVEPIQKALEEAYEVDKIVHVSQQQIDEATEVLKNSMKDVASGVHKYYTDINYALEDPDGWRSTFKESTVASDGNGRIKHYNSIKTMTVASYMGKPIDKTKIMSFTLKTDMGNAWTGIGIQNEPVAGQYIWSNSGRCGFLVVFKPDVIELQKWGLGGTQEIYTVDNTVLKSNEEANVEFGVINFGAGNRMILNINGINLFDMIDYNSPITEDLYLTLYTGSDMMTEPTYLSAAGSMPQNEIYGSSISGSELGIGDVFGKNGSLAVTDWLVSEERVANNSNVSFELTRSEDNEKASILFKQDTTNVQAQTTEGTGYELAVTDDRLVLYKYKQGRMQIVASADNGYVLKGTTNNISINEYTIKDGVKIEISINGEAVINVTDFYPVKNSGYFAIGAGGGSVTVK